MILCSALGINEIQTFKHDAFEILREIHLKDLKSASSIIYLRTNRGYLSTDDCFPLKKIKLIPFTRWQEIDSTEKK